MCANNSCLSQMAEALLRHYGDEFFEVHSAGMEPAEQIHPLARRVMEEKGIGMKGQEPTDMENYLVSVATGYVIILWGQTAERCPVSWPGVRQRLIWPFEDPSQYKGPD
ncbi:MAG: arsenate reductase ArsC [Candidatus Brocadiia bacterium]